MKDFANIVALQRGYFLSGATRPVAFRLSALRRLKAAIAANEALLTEALLRDLNKPAAESFLCEIGIIYEEIAYHINHLKRWVKNRRVATPLAQFRSTSFVSPEPYGVALIMAPWNYPMQLCFAPLIGAISAGNCAVLKPSAYAPETSHVIAKIVAESFDNQYVTVVEGGREENSALLAVKFDYIFFTGSVAVGKIVMAAAAQFLTPLSLELGGKSPVIVDDSADIEVAARRIAFGKVLNAGQTCVAPDYLFIHESVRSSFIDSYKKAIAEFFPNNDFSDMPHIVNDKHFRRLCGLMEGERDLLGGRSDEAQRLITPVLLDDIAPTSPIMQEEIFGPLLPMLTYRDLDECVRYIQSQPKPLALYLFTKRRAVERRILGSCSFGGGCVNDTIIHLATTQMGFGGVGESGMGSYHGKASFDTFSHYRSIVRKRFFPDIKMRYRPYSASKLRWIRRFFQC